eukprot:3944991-Prymnesium_polylepis.1
MAPRGRAVGTHLQFPPSLRIISKFAQVLLDLHLCHLWGDEEHLNRPLQPAGCLEVGIADVLDDPVGEECHHDTPRLPTLGALSQGRQATTSFAASCHTAGDLRPRNSESHVPVTAGGTRIRPRGLTRMASCVTS